MSAQPTMPTTAVKAARISTASICEGLLPSPTHPHTGQRQNGATELLALWAIVPRSPLDTWSCAMNREEIKGAAREAAGKVKQAVGKATGDRKLEAEGFAEKTKGKLERKVGKAA